MTCLKRVSRPSGGREVRLVGTTACRASGGFRARQNANLPEGERVIQASGVKARIAIPAGHGNDI